jgi:hypothetical protein
VPISNQFRTWIVLQMADASCVEAVQRDQGEAAKQRDLMSGSPPLRLYSLIRDQLVTKNLHACNLCSLFSDRT